MTRTVSVSRFVALLSPLVAFCRSVSRLDAVMISQKWGWISKIRLLEVVLQKGLSKDVYLDLASTTRVSLKMGNGRHMKNPKFVAAEQNVLKIGVERGVRENHTGIIDIEGSCWRWSFCRGVLDFFAVRSVAKVATAFHCFGTKDPQRKYFSPDLGSRDGFTDALSVNRSPLRSVDFYYGQKFWPDGDWDFDGHSTDFGSDHARPSPATPMSIFIREPQKHRC